MTNSNDNNSNDVPKFRAAFLEAKDEIAAVPEDDFVTINVDILAATTTVMGALHEIAAMRSQFTSHLPLFDMQQFDKLELFTLAANHAHTQFLGSETPAEAIPELSGRALEVRELLLSDASALAKRGYFNPARLTELKGSNGYRNTASDVLTLAGILRDNWAKVSGKTGVTLEELDSAESLGYRLLNAVGSREQGPSVLADVAQTRQRAYTLFFNAYDQVRRAICYLRWNEDDADDIAPSLFAGRGGRRTAGDSETDPGEGTTSPLKVAPTFTAPKVAAPIGATPVPIGMPGSDPFTH